MSQDLKRCTSTRQIKKHYKFTCETINKNLTKGVLKGEDNEQKTKLETYSQKETKLEETFRDAGNLRHTRKPKHAETKDNRAETTKHRRRETRTVDPQARTVKVRTDEDTQVKTMRRQQSWENSHRK